MTIEAAKNKVPEYCKNCALLWLHGAKDGKHDRHCCHFGKPAPKVWKHCKENGGKVSKLTGRQFARSNTNDGLGMED